MNIEDFSIWKKWVNRDKINNINYPGIYAISISLQNIEDKKFSWLAEIKYIGMTNSVSGLKGRLKQFDNTIIGKTGHGGADRFRYKHQDYKELIEHLYVSVMPFQCNVKSNNPEDLRIMGKVAQFEYDCFAEYVNIFGCLPEFNDKIKSKKYSLTYGKSNS